MITFILWTGYFHFFGNACVIRPALGAGGFKGAEGWLLTAGALEHNALRAPSVDLAHLHVLNLVVDVDALDYPHHHSIIPLLHDRICSPVA